MRPENRQLDLAMWILLVIVMNTLQRNSKGKRGEELETENIVYSFTNIFPKVTKEMMLGVSS
jgi:hypothetical protein